MPSGYNRYFVTLKVDNKNYGYKNKAPLGRCIVEVISSYGKISVIAQDLKPEIAYKIYILFKESPNTLGVCVGTLYVDAKGKGEFKIDVNPTNVFGSGYDINNMDGVILLVANKAELTSPLVGFVNNSFDWKDNFLVFNEGSKKDGNKHKSPEPEASSAKTEKTVQAELPQPEVSQEETPQPEVSQAELPQPEVSQAELPQPEVSQEETPQPEVSQAELTQSEISQEETPQPEVSQAELTQPEVSQAELTQPEVSQAELPQPEVSQAELTQPETSGINIFPSATFLQEAVNKPDAKADIERQLLPETIMEDDYNEPAIQEYEGDIDDSRNIKFTRIDEPEYKFLARIELDCDALQVKGDSDCIRLQENIEVTADLHGAQEVEHKTVQETAHCEPQEVGQEAVQDSVETVVEEFDESSEPTRETVPEYRALSSKERRLEYIFRNNIEMTPFKVQSSDIKWVRISNREPVNLSLDYQKLFNHHFITLSYKKYKHLILGISRTEPHSYCLGIPDAYSYEHKLIALSLGFTQFKCCDDVKPSVGEYGYWIMAVV